MTLVAAINAAGKCIQPYCIFKEHLDESWANSGLDDAARFSISETGFSSQKHFLDWFRHFNRQSFGYHSLIQKEDCTFEGWFGVDEYGFSTRYNTFKNLGDLTADDALQLQVKDKIYRMLVIDGFTGHIDEETFEYAQAYDIELIVLPPHSTHRLQPLDVGVFQWFKQSHQRAIEQVILEGEFRYTRNDFVNALKQMLDEAFTAKHILDGWNRTGLYPPDREKVLKVLRAEQVKITTPALQSLLPADDQYDKAANGIKKITGSGKYSDIFSSPTRQELRAVASTVNEAIALKDSTERFINYKARRLEKLSTIHGKHKVRILGPVTSLNISDLRAKSQVRLAEAERVQQSKEWLQIKRLRTEEYREKKELWRVAKLAALATGQKGLSWKQWLVAQNEATYEDDYIALNRQPNPFAPVKKPHLQQETSSFILDTEGRRLPPGPILQNLERIQLPDPDPDNFLQISDDDISGLEDEELVDEELEEEELEDTLPKLQGTGIERVTQILKDSRKQVRHGLFPTGQDFISLN